MDMNMRDWLVILGVLTVLVVIIDAIRRVWLARRHANELNFGLENIKKGSDEDMYGSELPSGGARVVSVMNPLEQVEREKKVLADEDEHDELTRIEPFFDSADNDSERMLKKNGSINSAGLDFVRGKDGGDMVSTVRTGKSGMDAVQLENNAIFGADKDLLSGGQNMPETDVPAQKRRNASEGVSTATSGNNDYRPFVDRSESGDVPGQEDLPVSDAYQHDGMESGRHKTSLNETSEQAAPKTKEMNAEPGSSCSAEAKKHDVLIVNVVAAEGCVFPGESLCALMASESLTLGEMNVFHRYVRVGQSDSGTVYSVANGVEPGYFESDALRDGDFFALSFFIALPGPLPPEDGFTAMIKSAQRVANAMGGVLKDERHNVMTQAMLENYRSRVRRFEEITTSDLKGEQEKLRA